MLKRYHFYIVLETPHVIVGAAIATKIANPLLSIPLAFGSHFLLDRIPHWNPHLNTEMKKHGKPTKKSSFIVVADVCTALFVGFFIASKAMPDMAHAATILAASFAAVLPDVMEGPYFFLGIKKPPIPTFSLRPSALTLSSERSVLPSSALAAEETLT